MRPATTSRRWWRRSATTASGTLSIRPIRCSARMARVLPSGGTGCGNICMSKAGFRPETRGCRGRNPQQGCPGVPARPTGEAWSRTRSYRRSLSAPMARSSAGRWRRSPPFPASNGRVRKSLFRHRSPAGRNTSWLTGTISSTRGTS